MKYRIEKNEVREINGRKLFRIYATKCFTTNDGREISEGTRGGWVEGEGNLSQNGTSWVADEAAAFGAATVCGNAIVCDFAKVEGRARVEGEVKISNNASVYGNALIYGRATMSGRARAYDFAQVYEDAQLLGDVSACEYADVHGAARLSLNMEIRK